jgi:hypothetical protein
LFSEVVTAMPKNDPASLSPQTYVDIMGYLFQANEIPAGDTELPSEGEALETILITEKPKN